MTDQQLIEEIKTFPHSAKGLSTLVRDIGDNLCNDPGVMAADFAKLLMSRSIEFSDSSPFGNDDKVATVFSVLGIIYSRRFELFVEKVREQCSTAPPP